MANMTTSMVIALCRAVLRKYGATEDYKKYFYVEDQEFLGKYRRVYIRNGAFDTSNELYDVNGNIVG